MKRERRQPTRAEWAAITSSRPVVRRVLEREYRRRVAEVRSTPDLSWEKQERQVRELGLRYDRERCEREAEERSS